MFVSNNINMTKIQLDVPSDLHVEIKQIQLAKESNGEKVNLKELYIDVLKKGITETKKEKAAK
jgi:hypothetical protein